MRPLPVTPWLTPYRLLDRVANDETVKDHAEYGKNGSHRLSFNKLRKTSGNWIRRIADGEKSATTSRLW